MKEMPGIMSRMPALPVSINDDLASSLLSSTTQVTDFVVMVISEHWEVARFDV